MMMTSLVRKLKQLIHTRTSYAPSWRGAALALFIATIALCIISALDLFDNSTPFIDVFGYFIIEIIFLASISLLSILAIVAFQQVPLLFAWALFCFFCALCYFFLSQVTTSGFLLIALWIIFGLALSGSALYTLIAAKLSKQHPPRRLVTYGSLTCGILLLSMLCAWLFTNHSSSIPPYIISNLSAPAPLSLPDPSLAGNFPVKYMTYGSGSHLHRPEFGEKASIKTPTINGSAFIRNWEGIGGWLRSRYWGFDVTALPLNGLIWYPEGEGSFPLVLIVHGNHEMTASSDAGYAYLGNLLASRGFIVASIDENFLNSTWHSDLNESPGRGWLLLEHLKLWRSWNGSSENPFFQKVDMDRIALIGHSRGGEAITAAAILNHLKYYPGNGSIKMDYGFNIQALAAIAPIDAQFKPGGLKIKLSNIDYLVIQGSHDGDVRSFEGSAQFHRISLTGPHYHFKAALYIIGADHGQFNEIWKNKDNPSPTNLLFDQGQLIPGDQQRQIAKVYISAFLESSLNKQKNYLPLFQNYRTGDQWLPPTIYLNEFADSTFLYIDSDDKTDIDISKTSLTGGTQVGQYLDIWRQDRVPLKDGGPVQIGIYLGWDALPDEPSPTYTIQLPERNLKLNANSILVLDLADANNTDTLAEDNSELEEINQSNKPIDFNIEITDRHGQAASLPLSHFAYLQPGFDVNLMKAAFLDPIPSAEFVFQSFEFPLSKFIERNPSLSPADIHTIRFIFNINSYGLIIVDSIAFRQPLP